MAIRQSSSRRNEKPQDLPKALATRSSPKDSLSRDLQQLRESSTRSSKGSSPSRDITATAVASDSPSSSVEQNADPQSPSSVMPRSSTVQATKQDLVRSVQQPKEDGEPLPEPVSVLERSTRTTSHAPGAFYAVRRGVQLRPPETEENSDVSTASSSNRMSGTNNSADDDHETLHVNGELVAARTVRSEETMQDGGGELVEVYKAEPVVTDSRLPSYRAMIACAIICVGFGLVFVAMTILALLVKPESEESPLETSLPTMERPMVNPGDYAHFTQYVVFIGADLPSLCANSGVSVDIECINSDLIMDPPNSALNNITEWEITSSDKATGSLTSGEEFGYVTFACAGTSGELSAAAVQLHETEVDCRTTPFDSLVVTGMSFGRLCLEPLLQSWEYDTSDTVECHALSQPFRNGCVDHQVCRSCITPSMYLESTNPDNSCQASNWNETVFGEDVSSKNSSTLSEFTRIVEDHSRFYKLADEERA